MHFALIIARKRTLDVMKHKINSCSVILM